MRSWDVVHWRTHTRHEWEECRSCKRQFRGKLHFRSACTKHFDRKSKSATSLRRSLLFRCLTQTAVWFSLMLVVSMMEPTIPSLPMIRHSVRLQQRLSHKEGSMENVVCSLRLFLSVERVPSSSAGKTSIKRKEPPNLFLIVASPRDDGLSQVPRLFTTTKTSARIVPQIQTLSTYLPRSDLRHFMRVRGVRLKFQADSQFRFVVIRVVAMAMLNACCSRGRSGSSKCGASRSMSTIQCQLSLRMQVIFPRQACYLHHSFLTFFQCLYGWLFKSVDPFSPTTAVSMLAPTRQPTFHLHCPTPVFPEQNPPL